MRNITVKHTKPDPRNGHVNYRRRIPKALASSVGKTEFVTTPGRAQEDALVNYGPYHQKTEHMIALAKNGVAGLSPSEQRERLAAMPEGWSAAPFGPGQDENERTWRDAEAGRMIDR